MTYNALGVVFILLEAALILFLGYVAFVKKNYFDKKSLVYITPTYLLTYALYLLCGIYMGDNIDFFYCFNLIGKSFSVYGFDIDTSLVADIMEEFTVYKAVFVLLCFLSVVTTVFGVVVLFGGKVVNFLRKRRILHNNGDIVLGYSPDSLTYVKVNKNTVLWADIDSKTLNGLVAQGIAVTNAPQTAKVAVRYLTKGEHHIIAFKDTNFSFSKLIDFFEDIKCQKDSLLYLHLEASAEEMRIVQKKFVSEVTEQSNSFISSFSRHELIARNFVMNYPISKFVPSIFFNENKTLKDDKQINVVFVGFGRVNYEVFKQCVVQFQFVKNDGNGRLKVAPVNYYVYDSDESHLQRDALLKIQYRFDEAFAGGQLPPAEKICRVKEAKKIDVNSAEARLGFRNLVDENNFTMFVVSLKDDLVDASYAESIKSVMGQRQNYMIFARAKKNDNSRLNKNESKVVYFGEDDVCTNRDTIVNEELIKLSRCVNDLYNQTTQDRIAAIRSWESLPIVEQYSNISSALGVPFKLNLLGFDIAKGGISNITEKDYALAYGVSPASSDEENPYFATSRANVLAYSEHSRWVAFYFLFDYTQLPTDGIKWVSDSNGMLKLLHKNPEAKQHACMTSYYGLDKLIDVEWNLTQQKMACGCSDKLKKTDRKQFLDIYAYDCMVLDSLYNSVNKAGYAVVKNK